MSDRRAPREPAPPPGPSPASTTGWGLVPLRLFLGVTFAFAGGQKLADPRFFRPSYPGSIQAQLHAAAAGSPIRPLLDVVAHFPVLIGVVLALGQLAVGAATLLGLAPRLAAVGGMAISAALFLTVSFRDSPYYLGSDIVFLFAWTPLALVGTGGAWSLDVPWRRLARPGHGRHADHGRDPALIGRREVLQRARPIALIGAVALLAGGLAEWIAGRSGRPPGARTRAPSSSTGPPMAGAGGPATTGPGGQATAPGAGRPIGRVGAVPPGQALGFTDPATGDPAYVVQPSAGRLVAFDAICPHARCRVGYVPGASEFVCPCHGSRFDGRTGALLAGPATVGLTPIAVVESPDGTIYAGGPRP